MTVKDGAALRVSVAGADDGLDSSDTVPGEEGTGAVDTELTF